MDHLEAVRLEVRGDERADLLLVVDDHHSVGAHGASVRPGPRGAPASSSAVVAGEELLAAGPQLLGVDLSPGDPFLEDRQGGGPMWFVVSLRQPMML